jgi:hypothetical protein
MVNSDLGKHFLLVYSQDAKLLYTEPTESALEKFYNGHYSVIYSALFLQTFAHRRHRLRIKQSGIRSVFV